MDNTQLVADYLKKTSAESRPYQLRVIEKAYNLFEEGKARSVLVESPTGSGKTLMALTAAGLMHKYHGARVGWVAMRRPLLKQAEEENRSKGFNIPITYISMFEKNVPTDLDMLVVDEAHHDVTNSMAHIHAEIEPKWLLGNTATVQRHDKVKLCFDSVIKDAGIATLIQDGWLSAYHHYTLPEWSVDSVVEFYLREPERWGKSLIYFHKVLQCEEAAIKFRAAGINVEVVTGDSDVDQQLLDFRADKVKILINCMKLVEGVDVPDVKTVFCRPSCKPLTIQMAGRVLRKHKDHPYKQIVQTKKAPYQFQKTALAALQHIWVDNGWRTLEVNKNIAKIMQQTTIALAQTKSTMPAFITNQHTKDANRIARRINRLSGRPGQGLNHIPTAPGLSDS
jgi:superfamily II DNA or RNA helicase